MGSIEAVLAGVGSALPKKISSEDFWDGFYCPFYGRGEHRAERRAELIFRSMGVESRHCAVDPTIEDVASWTTAERLGRFAYEAPPLGKRAVKRALEDAGIGPGEVDELVVATCTGYEAPGLDLRVAQDTGMRNDVGRTHIGHMGCYAALPALKVADAFAGRGRITVVLCLELTSLHIQPFSGDQHLEKEQMVSHALFADAASAAVLVPDVSRVREDNKLRVSGFESVTDHSSAALMTWEITDMGFRMGLSADVPKALSRHVSGLIETLLAPAGLKTSDVTSWAVHPGGPEILDIVEQQLGIPESLMTPSWDVLRNYGNCSSATVLLILEHLLQAKYPSAPGEALVAIAFGPGLSAHAALLMPPSQ